MISINVERRRCDVEGESGSLDLDTDGEVTIGLFDRWSWSAGADAPDFVGEIEAEALG